MNPTQDFDKRHGEDCIVHEDMVLFPDGAYRENSSSRWLLLAEPDPNPHKRARQIVKYWTIRLQQQTRQFDLLKHNLAQAAAAAERDGGFCPPSDSIEQLKAIKADIEVCSSKLHDAEAGLTESRPEQVKQREAEMAERREAARKFRNKLNQITV